MNTSSSERDAIESGCELHHFNVPALSPSRSAYSAAVMPLRFHSRTRPAQLSRVAIGDE
ncbi:MAG: hypothetical protein INH37_22020 [Myxococcaceae bacterium]|nr:hypothetical protein [Myxococcaceae bacterium]